MIRIKPKESSVLVFVHVKKTAGISLQRLLSSQFGSVFYGGHTHSALKSRVCHNNVTKQEVSKLPDGSCICKHWSMSTYLSIRDKCNFVTVFRHPLDRIVSHYNFYRQHHTKGVNISEYIRDTKNINVCSKMINPDQLCEFYLFDTLQEDINSSEIISGKIKKLNKTNYKFNFSSDQQDDFLRLNENDMELYKWAKSKRKMS